MELSKPDLVAQVAEKAGITKADAERAVNGVIDTIIETIGKGGSVNLVGFGKFEVRERAARDGINPKTKEKIKIAATRVAAFKPGKRLKDMAAK